MMSRIAIPSPPLFASLEERQGDMKFWIGALGIASVVIFSLPVWSAEGTPGSGKTSRAQGSTAQQSPTLPRSTDTTENESSAKELNTGSDLTGGRDSHLGPHDPEEIPKQKKTEKSRAGTGR
jgi:hypothetical protein